MEHINENFVGWFTFPRLYKDMVNKMEDGSSFVEVGVYEGKSLAYFLVEMINANKKFNVTGVDSFTFEGLFDKFQLNMQPVIDKFDVVIDQSWDASKEFEDKTLDFVFIDADHVYENVKKDILAWLPKVKSGGTIAGHDYVSYHPGVIQAVNEIFGDNFSKEYIDEVCWMVKVES